MELEKLIEKIKSIKKGSFIGNCEWYSEKGNGVRKVSKGVLKIGIDYANMKENKEIVTGGLPYGQWYKGYEGYIIINDKGNLQLRVYTTKNPNHKVETKWYHNGIETTKEDIVANGILPPSKVKSYGNDKGVFNIPIEHIISLGRA